jgi:hypothetical protein
MHDFELREDGHFYCRNCGVADWSPFACAEWNDCHSEAKGEKE